MPGRQRLALGTAQFGLPYGIANSSGQVRGAAVTSILGEARAAGVDTLDTAIAYGTSETALGEAGVRGWRIVTKLPPVPAEVTNVADWIRTALRGSLERLKVDSVWALLLHRPQQLLEPRADAIHAALLALKTDGLVEKIGISIYDPEELAVVVARYPCDLVQAPANVLDRRLLTSGWLATLHRDGVEVHVRSAFLQGLLLLGADQRPPYFRRWAPLWLEWAAWIESTGITPVQACIGFLRSIPEIDRIVVGVDSRWHLREVLAAFAGPAMPVPANFAREDSDLINPARWPTS